MSRAAAAAAAAADVATAAAAAFTAFVLASTTTYKVSMYLMTQDNLRTDTPWNIIQQASLDFYNDHTFM
jgi:hypothetical protein